MKSCDACLHSHAHLKFVLQAQKDIGQSRHGGQNPFELKLHALKTCCTSQLVLHTALTEVDVPPSKSRVALKASTLGGDQAPPQC